MSNIIEKAKWQVGDIKTDKNGNHWETLQVRVLSGAPSEKLGFDTIVLSFDKYFFRKFSDVIIQ